MTFGKLPYWEILPSVFEIPPSATELFLAAPGSAFNSFRSSTSHSYLSLKTWQNLDLIKTIIEWSDWTYRCTYTDGRTDATPRGRRVLLDSPRECHRFISGFFSSSGSIRKLASFCCWSAARPTVSVLWSRCSALSAWKRHDPRFR